MDFFDYIANNCPESSNAVLNHFGYRINSNNMPQALRDLVNYEGEEALRRLVDIHPDKEIMLHYHTSFYEPPKQSHERMISMNNGNSNNTNNIMMVFLMGATLLIAAAIISNK